MTVIAAQLGAEKMHWIASYEMDVLRAWLFQSQETNYYLFNLSDIEMQERFVSHGGGDLYQVWSWQAK